MKFASTWILASLRNRVFFSFEEAAAAVSQKLEELNIRPFKKRVGNRRLAFENEEKEFMQPLPKTLYESLQSDLTLDQKNQKLSRLAKIKYMLLNIMLVGGTGCGKSSTVSAMLDMNVSKVGVGVDPETSDTCIAGGLSAGPHLKKSRPKAAPI